LINQSARDSHPVVNTKRYSRLRTAV